MLDYALPSTVSPGEIPQQAVREHRRRAAGQKNQTGYHCNPDFYAVHGHPFHSRPMKATVVMEPSKLCQIG